MNIFSRIKVGGLCLLDLFNNKFEPWEKFDRAVQPKVLPADLEKIKEGCLTNLDNFLDSERRFFRNTEKDALGDACIWQGVYSSLCSFSKDPSYKGQEGLAKYIDSSGILLRGVAPKGAPWFVVDPNHKYYEIDNLTVRDDASLDSLAGFCFGVAVALKTGTIIPELNDAMIRLAQRMASDNYKLKNLDGTDTQHGNCTPGVIQAPVRILAAAVVAYLGERCGGVAPGAWKRICNSYGCEFSRTESHLLWKHPWFNDNLALLFTASALMLETDFGNARKGMQVLLEKYSNYGNSFAIYLASYCGISPTSTDYQRADKILIEFNEYKVVGKVINDDYPSVVFDKKRVAKQPVPVWRRPNTDFIWQRNPYTLEGEDYNKYPSLDFLITYFLKKLR